MSDVAARAVFHASLPTGDKGELIPGHTEWDQLGPKAQDRYRRMAQAALSTLKRGYDPARDCLVIEVPA